MSELRVSLSKELAAEPDTDFEARRQLVDAMRVGEPVTSKRPRTVGRVANRELFSGDIDFDTLTIGNGKRFASGIQIPFFEDLEDGTARYHIPAPLDQLREALEIIAAYEHANYPSETRTMPGEAKVGVDQSAVPAGETQRSGATPRIHRDGAAGRWQHLYLVSGNDPTMFFETDATEALNERKGGIGFSQEKLGAPFVPDDYEIVLANSTTLHASPIMEEGGSRTFLRVIYQHDLPA